jgi:hypothetical protein
MFSDARRSALRWCFAMLAVPPCVRPFGPHSGLHGSAWRSAFTILRMLAIPRYAGTRGGASRLARAKLRAPWLRTQNPSARAASLHQDLHEYFFGNYWNMWSLHDKNRDILR